MRYLKGVVILGAVGLAASAAFAEGPGAPWTEAGGGSEQAVLIVQPGGAPAPGGAVAAGPDGAVFIRTPDGDAVGIRLEVQPGLPGQLFFSEAPPPPPFGPPPAKVKVTFLGVATSPVSETLGEQLKLPRGTGLVVDFVGPDSPAAKAGIKRHDVLTKLDDQILVNPPQLAVLVRLHKPGDKVALALLREGQEQKITTELGESMQPPLTPEGFVPFGLVMPEGGPSNSFGTRIPWRIVPGMPGNLGTSANRVFADGEHTLTMNTRNGEKYLVAKDKTGKVVFEGPVQTDEQRRKVPPDLLKKLEKLEATTKAETRSEVAIDDGEHTLTLTTTDGKKHLLAKDKSGKVIFDGPIDTEEQLKAVPEEIREKVKSMNVIIINRPAPEPGTRGTPL